MNTLPHREHEFDVCIIGGGMAGMCAAIAAARNGAQACLIHDRPVFGGNASSEIRMWICGAHGRDNKETGLLEEIQLANLHRNPSLHYSIWDSVLYEKVAFQPGLTMLLNCSCTDADMAGDRITRIRAWQLTTQTWHTVNARLFIDCSGDSILAPLTGAQCRWGREARDEFNEDIEPPEADHRTMGNSILIQLRRTDDPQPFIPPKWAWRFETPEDLAYRVDGVQGTNFWWIELGGIDDTIHDAERLRDDLLKAAWGVWDYIKNRAPEREKAANWALEWVGSLPGKRENRRYEGPHILTQHDVASGGDFDDIIGHGGWTMDDHHPAGLLYPGKPTNHHHASSPFGIPYRCLYSVNVANLMFAGRNISTTHAALSATRVMATCAVVGQAAGTAAAIALQHGIDPSALYPDRIGQLQQTLMDDDQWLPGLARRIGPLSQQAAIEGDGDAPGRVLDGHDRDRGEQSHAWTGPLGSRLELAWPQPQHVGGVRMTFDSDLRNDKRMPCSYPHRADRCLMPRTLIRAFRIELRDADGRWETVYREQDNTQRLLRVALDRPATGVRLVPEATWGASEARIFAFEAMHQIEVKSPRIPEGPTVTELRRSADAEDIAPPACEREPATSTRHGA